MSIQSALKKKVPVYKKIPASRKMVRSATKKPKPGMTKPKTLGSAFT